MLVKFKMEDNMAAIIANSVNCCCVLLCNTSQFSEKCLDLKFQLWTGKTDKMLVKFKMEDKMAAVIANSVN